jgi:hypothetical protein
MPVERTGEKPGAERFDNDAAPAWYETTYVIEGSENPVEAEAAALAIVPLTRTGRAGTLKRRGLTIRHIGYKVYEADAHYDAGDGNDWTFRVSVRGKMQKILVGEHVATFKRSDDTLPDTPNHKGLINVRPDGKVEGIEIPVPATYLTISKRFEAGVITPQYVDNLDSLSFCTNNATWPSGPFGWEEGRLLFLGAELVDGRYTPLDIDLNFELGKHLVDVTKNDVTFSKKAHDVLWWEEKPAKTFESSSGTKSYVPKYAHVERVFDSASYAIFGF